MNYTKRFILPALICLVLVVFAISLGQTRKQSNPQKPETCCAMDSCCCKGDSCDMKNHDMKNHDMKKTDEKKNHEMKNGCCCCSDSCEMKQKQVGT